MTTSSSTLATFAMATVRVKKPAEGTVRYTARVRIKRDGAQIYQETQSFVRKQAAQVWIRRREAELYEPDTIEKANRVVIPLAEIIDRYLQEVEKARPLGKTKRPESDLADHSRSGGGFADQ